MSPWATEVSDLSLQTSTTQHGRHYLVETKQMKSSNPMNKRKLSGRPSHVEKSKLALRATLLLCILTFGAWQLYAWWNTPPVVQLQNLRFIQLLHTACSSRNANYVLGVERTLQDAYEKKQVSEPEYRWFTQLIAIAKTNEWQKAEKRTSEFATAQQSRKR